MEPKSIGESLRDFLGHSDVVRQNRATRRWAERWAEVAGADVLAHTQVRGVHRGVLTVAVDAPPLLHELASFRRADLLRALNERPAGDPLKDIHFRHAPL